MEALLLGAGATQEAGVPTAYGFTQAILEHLEWRYRPREVRFLKFVAGGLLFQAGVRGDNPFAGVDVEELFNAVELLGRRHRLEAAPFIASWHEMVNRLEEEVIEEEWEKEEKEAERAVVAGSSYIPRPGAYAARRTPGQEYRALADSMLDILAELVIIDDTRRLAYLDPILELAKRQSPLTVATLNYDLSLETAAEAHGVPLDCGVQTWTASSGLRFQPCAIRLLKLHGSIDWRLRQGDRDADTPMPEKGISMVDRRYFQQTPQLGTGMVYPASTPGLIFGLGNKLRPEGPFLDLLRQFAADLHGAQVLTVIGYSFRDEHINHQISIWLNGGASRRLRVIDPGFCKNQQPYAVLLRQPWFKSRLEVHEVTASEGLAHVFSSQD